MLGGCLTLPYKIFTVFLVLLSGYEYNHIGEMFSDVGLPCSIIWFIASIITSIVKKELLKIDIIVSVVCILYTLSYVCYYRG